MIPFEVAIVAIKKFYFVCAWHLVDIEKAAVITFNDV
jgi:hypothetical protein